MAAEAPRTAADNSRDFEPWSILQLESALAHLERMQERIDNLRSAIPDLVKPLRHRTSSSGNDSAQSKTAVFMGVKTAAAKKTEELRVFDETWRSGETQRILERIKESEARDPHLGRCGEVARWGWVEKEQYRNGEEED